MQSHPQPLKLPATKGCPISVSKWYDHENGTKGSHGSAGIALQRIIVKLADAQEEDQELFFAKLDINDGFWRIIVGDEDAWNLCYAIPNPDPTASRDDIWIVVPNSLQMGCESPPFFCAASETARDVIQQLLKVDLPPHPFEHYMLPDASVQLPKEAIDMAHTMDLIEVFMDNCVGCTDNLTRSHLVKFTQAMMHGMHSIFQPPSVTGHTGGDPISKKSKTAGRSVWTHQGNSGMDSQRSKLHNLPARKEGSKNSNHPPANSKEKDGPAQRLSKNCGYIASCINGNPRWVWPLHSDLGSDERIQQRLDQIDTDSKGNFLRLWMAFQRNCK